MLKKLKNWKKIFNKIKVLMLIKMPDTGVFGLTQFTAVSCQSFCQQDLLVNTIKARLFATIAAHYTLYSPHSYMQWTQWQAKHEKRKWCLNGSVTKQKCLQQQPTLLTDFEKRMYGVSGLFGGFGDSGLGGSCGCVNV